MSTSYDPTSEIIDLTLGAWIFKTETDRHGVTSSRKVTFLREDGEGYVEYAEGWVDVRASLASNFTLTDRGAK